jgi:hypothetical protein
LHGYNVATETELAHALSKLKGSSGADVTREFLISPPHERRDPVRRGILYDLLK